MLFVLFERSSMADCLVGKWTCCINSHISIKLSKIVSLFERLGVGVANIPSLCHVKFGKLKSPQIDTGWSMADNSVRLSMKSSKCSILSFVTGRYTRIMRCLFEDWGSNKSMAIMLEFFVFLTGG